MADFLGIGAILGFVAGIIQLVSMLRDHGLRRAQRRLLEVAKAQLDAEDATAQAAQSAALVESLKRQIEHDLPNEARRAYLMNRLNHLSRSIADDYAEYSTLEAELADHVPLSPLSQQVRTVVEQTIVPAQQDQRRRERFTIVAIALLLVLTFVPYDLSRFVERQFIVLAWPFGYRDIDDVGAAIVGGVLFWAILTAMVGYLLHWSSARVLQRGRTLSAART